jgi:MFS family permease
MTSPTKETSMSLTTVLAPPDTRRASRLVGILLYLFIACSYIVNGMDRTVFANLNSYAQTDLHLNLAQSGFITTAFAIGFGITGLFAGYLLDKFKRKNVLVVGMLIYSVFTILIPLSQGFWDMSTYRVVTGIGEAMQQTAIFTMAGVFFAGRRNLALGGMNAAYGIGSFLGPIVGVQIFLAGSNNWHLPLYVFGIIGLIYAVLLLVFLPGHFSEYGHAPREIRAAGVRDSGGRWFSGTICLLVVANVLLGVVNYSYLGLYPTFLKGQLGFSVSTAALAASMYGVGAFAGLISGYFADKLGEKRLILIAIAGSIIVGLLMFDVARAPWQQIVLSLFFGIFNSGFLFVNIYALTQRSVPIRHMGKASGLASSAHYIGAGFAGAIFGAIAASAGWGAGSLAVFVLAPVIAGVCIILVRIRLTSKTEVAA